MAAPSRGTPLSDQAVLADAGLALSGVLATLALAELNYLGTTATQVIALLAVAVLAARRIAPLAAFWVILAPVVTVHDGNSLVSIAAAGGRPADSAAVYSRYRRLALLSLTPAGLILTEVYADTEPPLPGRVSALVIMLAITAIGNSRLRAWRVRAATRARGCSRASEMRPRRGARSNWSGRGSPASCTTWSPTTSA